MGSKNRPHREAKKKPKTQVTKTRLESLSEAPQQTVEVIKPKRKPRHEQEPEADEE